MGKFTTYLTAYWQGRVALLPDAVIIVIGGQIALSVIGRNAAHFLWLEGLAVGVLVWQIVGLLRGLNRRGPGGDASSWLGYSAVVIALAILGENMVHRWADRQPVAVSVVFARADAVPFAVEETTMLLGGEITYGTLASFDLTIAMFPDVAEIALTSDGGLIPAARAIARRIETAGLNTRAEGLCASACTLIFLAGQQRQLSMGATLGFHTYAGASYVQVFEKTDAAERDKQWMLARGIAPGFVAQIYETNHNDLWRPDRQTMLDAGVLTR